MRPGNALWTMYRSAIAFFCGSSTLTDMHGNLPIPFPASTNLLNDLAKAMKALDGKKMNAQEVIVAELTWTQHQSRVHVMIRCLEKNYWADSECALSAMATAALFTFVHVSPPVSPLCVTTLVATRRPRCLLRSVWMRCYASMAALCDLWDSGWVDPGFPQCALLLPSLFCMAIFFVSCLLFGLFLIWMAIVEDGTKVVIAINILERIAVP